MKRYIRVDIEYEQNDMLADSSWRILDNIRRILSEDMPYCKILATRDCPRIDELNNSFNHKWMSWKCSCGILNNGLNISCTGANQAVINASEHTATSDNSYDELVSYLAANSIRKLDVALQNSNMSVDDKEKLFTEFFRAECILVKDMDIPTLRAHRNTLEKIAFEARARLAAVGSEERDREAKLNSSQRSWIAPLDHNTNVSEAINTVNKRKERMSKFEKMAESMKALGMTDDAVKDMMGQVSKRATESAVDGFRFVKPKPDDNESSETAENTESSETKSESTEVKSNVFDASSLFGK